MRSATLTRVNNSHSKNHQPEIYSHLENEREDDVVMATGHCASADGQVDECHDGEVGTDADAPPGVQAGQSPPVPGAVVIEAFVCVVFVRYCLCVIVCVGC